MTSTLDSTGTSFAGLFSYLRRDHSPIEGDDDFTQISAWSEMFQTFEGNGFENMLVLGAGPAVLLEAIALGALCEKIILTDSDPVALNLSSKLLNTNRGRTVLDAHWLNYYKFAGHDEDSWNDFLLKIQIAQANAFNSNVSNRKLTPNSLITMPYVAESVTTNLNDFELILRNIYNWALDGNTFAFSFLVGAKGWKRGDDYIDCLNVNQQQILEIMKRIGYTIQDTETIEAPFDGEWDGYLLVRAQKIPTNLEVL